MLPILRSLFLLGAIALACGARNTISIDEDGQKKISALRSVMKDGLIRVTDSNFHKILRAGNRPYHSFVILNARNPDYGCDICGPAEDELQTVAHSYNNMNPDDLKDTLPIFFFAAEFTSNSKVFQDYNLQGAPVIVYFAPSDHNTVHSATTFPTNARYSGAELEAESFATFVRDHTDITVPIYRNPWPARIGALIVVAATLFFAFTFYKQFLQLWNWARSKMILWFLAAVSVYFISVSGFLFDVIRNTPTFGQSRKGLIVFSEQPGYQYGAEGGIIGMLQLCAGLTIIFMTRIIPKWRDMDIKNAGAITALIVFGSFIYFVTSAYKYKNPWYAPNSLRV